MQPKLFYFILIFPFACFVLIFPPAGCFSQVLFTWIIGSKKQVMSLLSMSCYRDLQQLVEAVTLNISCIIPGALTSNDHRAS